MNKSSTKIKAGKEQSGKNEGVSIDDNQRMKQALDRFEQTVNLETSAYEYKALIRHRGIHSAMDLLWIVMAYSILDYSLRRLGMWCVICGLADISKTALLERLKKCHAWLGYLVARGLMQHKIDFPSPLGLRVKLIDATVVCHPGSKGANWRLHVGFNLGQPSLDWVEITDGKGSENLNRFGFTEGDLCIADRAYALLSQIISVITQKAWFIVRVGWFRQPGLKQEEGHPFDIIAWLKNASATAVGQPFEAPVWIPTSAQPYPLRIIARQIPDEQAEEARRRLRKEAAKKGRTIDERSLFAAGFVMVISNLPASTYSALQVISLYRFRWQIEMAFKRLKSLTGLDQLRAKDPHLAVTYLYAKLLGALLLDHFVLMIRSRYPSWFLSQDHPLSLWRTTHLLWEQVCILVRGQISLSMILAVFPRLHRFLCDEPRRRVSQFVSAQIILDAF